MLNLECSHFVVGEERSFFGTVSLIQQYGAAALWRVVAYSFRKQLRFRVSWILTASANSSRDFLWQTATCKLKTNTVGFIGATESEGRVWVNRGRYVQSRVVTQHLAICESNRCIKMRYLGWMVRGKVCSLPGGNAIEVSKSYRTRELFEIKWTLKHNKAALV